MSALYHLQESSFSANPLSQPQELSFSANPFSQPQEPSFSANPLSQPLSTPQELSFSANPLSQPLSTPLSKPEELSFSANPFSQPQETSFFTHPLCHLQDLGCSTNPLQPIRVCPATAKPIKPRPMTVQPLRKPVNRVSKTLQAARRQFAPLSLKHVDELYEQLEDLNAGSIARNGLKLKDYSKIVDPKPLKSGLLPTAGQPMEMYDITTEAIDAYLRLITDNVNQHSLTCGRKEARIAFIPASWTSNLLNWRVKDWTYYFKTASWRKDMATLDYIFIPYLFDKKHWVLLGVSIRQHFIFTIDPHFHTGKNHTKLRQAYTMLQDMLRREIPMSGGLDWEWRKPKNNLESSEMWPRLSNSWDSGLFLLTNATSLACGYPLICFGQRDMANKRGRIAWELARNKLSGYTVWSSPLRVWESYKEMEISELCKQLKAW